MGTSAFGRRQATLLGVFALGLVAAPGCSDDETGAGGAGPGGSSSSSSSSVSSTGVGAATSSSSSSSAGPGGGGSGAEGGGGAGATGGVGGAGGAGGAGGEGGEATFSVQPFEVPLSAAGPDQLQSVVGVAGDKFVAAGFAATAVGGTRAVVAVGFTPVGPDNTFGQGGGVAGTPLVFVGGNDEIDITTQSTGKLLISATVANAGNPNDRDVAVVRLNADGSVDATFGVGGVRVLDLNTAHDNAGTLVGLDAARGLAVDGDDNIFIHAASRGLGTAIGGGPRTDTDFTVVKLDPNGTQDLTFGDAGQFRLDIAETNATARGLKALADGSLIVSGYANTPDVGSTVQAVVFKLTPAGDLDPAFSAGGLWHEQVLLIQTEVYNFAVHGNNIVTAGYGRNVGDTNDYVSLRLDATTGVRDLGWGGALNGAVLIDPSGAMLGSNARSALGLPDGSTVIIGSTGPGNMPAQDAVFAVLDASGVLDPWYGGTGINVLKLGADGNDQFWGGAVSGEYVVVVGYKGGGSAQTDVMNDDSWGAVFKMKP